ncbi:Wzz/FepE/Etk N-terminal domain-containing protein [Xylophilus sp. GOD-11R]|uniref:Wzz/FepE/Etk N-terminal domain-containing protein n=1 Tax=Xylophilus sp. GOD-11R TaxID=3089814 RepID=UPI00298CC076|nr:Wzz/FepE/Etk N-terminal domain-containing protein [Xylophilus sp. GOD-11R]WPB56117.1 Wzz/FepE/Etk N-terminal domain-containing protein [Xylophilus sp. GOD-11R]
MATVSLPSGLSSAQLIAMVRARRRLVLGVATATLLATAVVLLVMPRAWTASSDVYVDYKAADPISGRQFSAVLDESYLNTQVDILSSRAVTERVVDRLALRDKPEYREEVAKIGSDKAYALLIKGISDNTVAAARRNSRVIEVAYSAESPEQARDYANEIVRAYIALSAEIASNAARSRSEQYNAQLEKLRAEVNRIQDELTTYQQKVGILNVNERDDVANAEIGSLTASLVTLQNQRQEALGRQRTIDELLRSGRPEDLPEIGSQPPITDLKARLNDAERRLSEARSVLGPNHPRTTALIAERTELQARLAREVKSAVSTRRLDVDRLAAQQRDVERLIAVRQKKLLEQKAQRDTLLAYQRQLEGAERVYTAATQKYDDILMAGNISAVNLTVLRQAETPSIPSKPRVVSSLAASVVVGLILGLCAALLLEFGTRRLRSRDDLVRGLRLPVLGEIGMVG